MRYKAGYFGNRKDSESKQEVGEIMNTQENDIEQERFLRQWMKKKTEKKKKKLEDKLKAVAKEYFGYPVMILYMRKCEEMPEIGKRNE